MLGIALEIKTFEKIDSKNGTYCIDKKSDYCYVYYSFQTIYKALQSYFKAFILSYYPQWSNNSHVPQNFS